MSTRSRAFARPFTLALIAALAVLILPGGTARPASAASTDLFFSEYIEGSSNNKALEIYNGTPAAVDLAAGAYSITMHSNGAMTTSLAINLTGSIAPGDVHVVAHGSANAAILAQADQTNSGGWYNGNDAVALRKGGAIVDVIGQIGFDPLTEWGFGLTSTQNNTMLRKVSVEAGDTNGGDPFVPSLEWDGQAEDYVARLGAHPGFPPEPGPSVLSSSPADQATDVPTNAPITVTFSEPVTVDAGGASIDCIDASFGVTSNAAVWEFTYLPPLPIGTTCTITIEGDSVHDVDTNDPFDTMADDVTIEFTTVGAGDPCDDPFTPIPSIQGSGATAAITGNVTVQGVVTGDYEGPSPNLRGFYLQGAGDGNTATSDGIFIFNNIGGTSPNLVSLGDVVRVTGNAGENQDQTQVSALSLISCGTTDTVAPTDISFPAASPTALEAFEGMLVRVPETMTVTEHFQLGRFGQVVVSSEGRLQQPTAVVAPGLPAADLQAQNNLRKIIVDDESQTQNPDPIRFGRDGDPLSATNTLRGGDTVSGLTGVMTYTWAGNAASGNAYRIRPINALGGAVEFEAVNDRPGETVEVAGDVRVVGMNLLNYFNTFDGLPDNVDNCDFGLGGLPADCRGADTQAEFDRQWPKTVAAILSVDADVIGVNEIENDGYGPDSSLAHLVGKLNEATAPETYAYVDVDAGTGQLNAAGTDAIKVGVIYRPADVTPVGTTAALNSVEFVNGGDADPRSRPSIAQAFETTDGARFIVDVNHLKSKGTACTGDPAPNQPPPPDGQGNCNEVRTVAANALADWLASDPTGTGDEDILIVGDLNSYANEDPIVALEATGFVDLVEEFVDDPYSYVFDGQWGYLDYAMGTSSALDQVAGIVEWHINADEPAVLDYNTDFKTAGQLVSLYAPDRFRVSDHDPIVVGLDADSDRPEVDAGGPYEVEEGGTTELSATGSDPTDDDITYAWDLDGDGSFETDGQSVTFEAGTLQAPQTVTVTVQITDEHGQTSTDTADIRVIWDFGGYQPPANAGGVTLLNAGASLPVKFSLDGNQGLAVLDGDPTFQRHQCPTGATIGSPITAVASEPFAYDASTDTYRFTWKTSKAWTAWCGTLTVALADGEAYTMEVRFKP